MSFRFLAHAPKPLHRHAFDAGQGLSLASPLINFINKLVGFVANPLSLGVLLVAAALAMVCFNLLPDIGAFARNNAFIHEYIGYYGYKWFR